MFAPKGTPDDIVQLLSKEIAAIVKDRSSRSSSTSRASFRSAARRRKYAKIVNGRIQPQRGVDQGTARLRSGAEAVSVTVKFPARVSFEAAPVVLTGLGRSVQVKIRNWRRFVRRPFHRRFRSGRRVPCPQSILRHGGGDGAGFPAHYLLMADRGFRHHRDGACVR